MSKKEKILQKACNKIESMDNIAALNKAHITPFEYHFIRLVLRDFLKGATEIVILYKGVADWFSKNGFHVVMDQDRVNYIISI